MADVVSESMEIWLVELWYSGVLGWLEIQLGEEGSLASLDFGQLEREGGCIE